MNGPAILFAVFCSLVTIADGENHISGGPPKYPRYSFNYALSKLLWAANPEAFIQNAHFVNVTRHFVTELADMRQQYRARNLEFTDECLMDILSIIEGMFRGSNTYNYKWIDASGRLMPGVFGGAFHWPGSYYLCTGKFPQISANSTVPISELTTNMTRGSYCDLVIDLGIPFEATNGAALDISIGLCIPATCNFTEVLLLIEPILTKFSLRIDKSASYCHVPPELRPKDNWFWIATALAIFILLLLSCGTAVDLAILFKWKMKSLKNAGEEEETLDDGESLVEEDKLVNASTGNVVVSLEEKDLNLENFLTYRYEQLRGKPLIIRLLGAYAVPANVLKLIYTPRKLVVDENGKQTDHPLICLDGIRVISMAWIVYGHSLVFPLIVGNNAILFIQSHVKRWTFEVITSGTLSVDTFFLMSGILAAYFGIPQILRIKSVGKFVRFWCIYVLHRFIRLTPAYAVVLVFYTGFFLYAWDGPLYPQRAEMSDIQYCYSNWWVTYLNNLVHTSKMCVPWSWYLANEFQFSVVLAPIFLSLVKWHWSAGLSFAVALIVSCFCATFGLSYKNHFNPGMLSIDSFEVIYIKPYTRWGTYAVGLILGWMLQNKYFRLPQKTTVSKFVLITTAGMLFASLCCLSVVYGLYGLISGQQANLPNGVSAFYNAAHRIVFVIGISSIVFLCANRYAAPVRGILGWSGFVSLSRLTYGTYLLHPIIIMFIAMGSQNPSMLDDLSVFALFVATFCLSYVCSLVLTVAIESPVLWLEKTLLRY